MAISAEEVRAFIKDSKRGRQDWLVWAERSWNELKKRSRNNRLLSFTPNSAKKRAKYPAWYGIFKIRQPLLLSRIGIPVCKDSTQDGTDNVGASAAFFKERLAINIVKTFPFFDVLSTSRDDFLATNVGMARAYYERDEVKERVKEYIQPQKVEGSEDVIFVDGAGNVVQSDDIKQDDDGFFIETEQVIDVENERVCLDQVLYSQWYPDPDIKRFNRCERMAFELHFSVPQFKETFGARAYARLPRDEDNTDDAEPKRQTIKVYEYWDKYEREVVWLPENGTELIKPLKAHLPEDYEEDERPNGLYDLERFFPVPEPLITNQATDEFWPVPEFYQIFEIVEDIHVTFSRMMALTRAIRARVLFDNNVEGLQEALAEATEGDAFGVPNLAQSLISNGGTLDAVVQYIPVEKMIASLAQMYQALEQRLNTLYRLTGVSDLLQGLISDGTQRTFGERQMLEKYALNQHAEPQRKMQEFVRDCYELLCEVALRNFKDESLERYMIPQTAPPVHQQNFRAALGLLKNNRKRFRIELETDSTIQLNEQYDKQMRVELVNTLTSAIEKVANIATTTPALVAVELHALKFMIQGFRQGKMFQQEVTQAIDSVIEQMQAASEAEPPPSPDAMKMELEKQKLALEQQRLANESKLKEYEILSSERIETARLQLENQMASIKAQVDQMKAQNDASLKQGDQSLEIQRIQSDVALAQAKIATERDRLMLEAQKIASEDGRKQLELDLTARIADYDAQLKTAAQRLDEYRVQLDMQERYATEARLVQEAQLKQALQQMEIVQKQAETQNQAILAVAEARAMQPLAPPKAKRKIKVSRDEEGNLAGYEIESEDISGVG